MVDELTALFQVLYTHLRGANVLWGDNVTSESVAAAEIDKPFLQFFWAGGGNDLVSANRRNVQLTITVKAVANNMEQAQAMKAAVGDLLESSGSQDTSPQLPPHSDWTITTVTQDRIIYMDEMFEGALPIYHRGNQYVVTMERN